LNLIAKELSKIIREYIPRVQITLASTQILLLSLIKKIFFILKYNHQQPSAKSEINI